MKSILFFVPFLLLSCSDDGGASYPSSCTSYYMVRNGKNADDLCLRVFAPDNGLVRLSGDKTNGYHSVDVLPGEYWELMSCYSNNQTGPVSYGECL